MRVLLVANDCNPEWPSLPAVGYKACLAIAERTEATLATHVRNRANIERAGFAGRVVYIDNEYVAAPLHRFALWVRRGDAVAWTANVALRYPAELAFEWEVWKRFRNELFQRRFDVLHRVTPMSPTLASPLARWSPVPVVLGPLNGGLKWPPEFRAELHRERDWLTYVRSAFRLLPYYRSTYRRSAAILASFRHTIDEVPPSCRGRVINFSEVGLDPALFASDHPRRREGRTRFLFVGRLVPYKCVDVLLEAFGRSEALRRHELRIIGDGMERERLEAMARDLKLEGCVEFCGWKSQAEVGALMRECHVLAFPSIRELGAGVVIEAMACGVAPLVVDYGGPAGLVTHQRGVKVPLAPKAGLTVAFTREMESLAANPDRVAALGEAARRYALAHYSWQAKADKTLEIYRWVMGLRDRPAFPELDGAEHPEAAVNPSIRGAERALEA